MIKVFVYGALMKFPLIRKHGRAAFAKDYAVRMVHKGSVRFEPAFAGLVKAEGDTAWGVLAELSEQQWRSITGHEIDYTTQSLVVIDKDGTEHECISLESACDEGDGAEDLPSARYARILLNSAKHYQFPQNVIDRYADFYQRGSKVTLFAIGMPFYVRRMMRFTSIPFAHYSYLIGAPLIVITLIGMVWIHCF